jgi:hypothetical protein
MIQTVISSSSTILPRLHSDVHPHAPVERSGGECRLLNKLSSSELLKKIRGVPAHFAHLVLERSRSAPEIGLLPGP